MWFDNRSDHSGTLQYGTNNVTYKKKNIEPVMLIEFITLVPDIDA